MTEARPPVIFIHGLWLHATSWQPWIDLFTEAGYDASCARLARRPGHRRGGTGQPGEHRRSRHR